VALKGRQNPFSAGALPRADLAGGDHDTPPVPIVGWRGDTPPYTPTH